MNSFLNSYGKQVFLYFKGWIITNALYQIIGKMQLPIQSVVIPHQRLFSAVQQMIPSHPGMMLNQQPQMHAASTQMEQLLSMLT